MNSHPYHEVNLSKESSYYNYEDMTLTFGYHFYLENKNIMN